MIRAVAHRLLIGISLTIFGVLQAVHTILAVATQTFEARSEFHITLLTFGALAPFVSSLYILHTIEPRTMRLWLSRILAGALTFYTLGSAFLSFYRIGRKFSFDLLWPWYNLHDVYATLKALDAQLPFYLIICAILLGLHYIGLMKIYSSRQLMTTAKNDSAKALNVCAGSIALVLSFVWIDNEPRNVLFQAFKPTSEAARVYMKFYDDSVLSNKNNRESPGNSDSDRNLFLIHLESLNALLVNSTLTPNLLRIGQRDGVFFPRVVSPSVLTIRAQETILCSILPALKHSMASQQDLTTGLVCLPEILRRRGFRTLYFHSYPSLSFYNLAPFMKMIGFDELHGSDIMKPEDRLLSWGYPEDVFYQRVFGYLERFKGQKIFAYIAVNTTNHFPFYDHEKKIAYPQFESNLPYSHPATLRQRLANTTYIQDHFLGEMYQQFLKAGYDRTSHMMIFGDHSFPIGIHPNNIHSENHAFQENFVTSLALIPAAPDRKRFKVGTRADSLYSYLDLLPTLAEMYGIEGMRYYGRSFLNAATVKGQKHLPRCIVAVQPFGGGHIAVINYPRKSIYSLASNTVSQYDLEKDPEEASAIFTRKISSDSVEFLENCLKSMKPVVLSNLR